MDSEIKSKLRLGMECLPNQERREAYGKWLGEKSPRYKKIFQAAVDCYQKEEGAQSCLTEILGGLPREARRFHKEKKICLDIASGGETVLSGRGDRLDYIRHLLRTTTHDNRLDPVYRTRVHDIASFYFSQIPSPLPKIFEAMKKKSLEREARWQAYQDSKLLPREFRILVAKPCENEVAWQKHELKIEGFPYIVPVFLPKDNAYAWPIFEEGLKLHFLYLKFFITPEDLEKIFSPQDRPGLSVYISTGQDNFAGKSRACGFPGIGATGDFNFVDNRISLFLDFDATRGPYQYTYDIIGILTDNLYHELGHAIFSGILNPGSDPNNLAGLEKFYEWSAQKAVPNSEHRKILKSLPVGVNHANRVNPKFIEDASFLPNIPATESFSEEGNFSFSLDSPYYAATTSSEFFPEWVSEFLGTELIAEGLQGDFFAPLKPGPRYGRYLLMKQFFAPEGIEGQALSEENIEAVFHKMGIEAVFHKVGIEAELTPSEDPPSSPELPKAGPERQSSGYLSLPLRLGVHHLTAKLNGESLETNTGSIGLGLGYLSRAITEGFMGGMGVESDYYLLGTQDPDGLHVADANLWFLLGTNLGKVQLIAQPKIGLRHFWMEPENQTHLLLGGDVGLMLGHGSSLLFQSRFQWNGGRSLGAALQIDIPAFLR